jgi:D-glycero-alpha-D-manno-heptose-7-phosphate kinase
LIISRTPFRVSFAGGGTDLRSFYSKEPGQVLSTSIDKYVYVVVKRQVGIVEYKYRVNWSTVEFRQEITEIEHPIVRETLKAFKIDFPIEITTFADVPAETGLGSSSAFAVGLTHALLALKGDLVTKYQLAEMAAKLEVDILRRVMGKQDHFASSYGSLNVFKFYENETVSVEPVLYRPGVLHELERSLLLLYTFNKRNASEILKSQERVTEEKRDVLRTMRDLVDEMKKVISNGNGLDDIGELLHQGWLLKKGITNDISNAEIDEYYAIARREGAIGGKILGAGGGGFMLLYARPEKHEKIVESLPQLYRLPLRFDFGGSRITYYDQSNI